MHGHMNVKFDKTFLQWPEKPEFSTTQSATYTESATNRGDGDTLLPPLPY